MKRFKVEHVESTRDTLFFTIILENIRPDESSTIILNIYRDYPLEKEKKPKKLGNSFIKYPFKELYSMDKLPSGASFKLNFFLTVKNDAYCCTIFVNTLTDPTKLMQKPSRAIQEEEEQKAKEK